MPKLFMKSYPTLWRCCITLTLALTGLNSSAKGLSSPDKPTRAYPNRPVTLVVPASASGGTDIVARLLAQALSDSLKQTFVVENHPGVNGILGLNDVAKAPADGYRLLFTYASSMVVNPSLYPWLPYDTLQDFAPIAQVGQGGAVLVARKDLPVQTLQELVDYTQTQPKTLHYCSWGQGSGGHVTMEYLKLQSGMRIAHRPYKSTNQCVQDIVDGHIDAGFVDMSSIIGLVQSGHLRALAHSSSSPLPMLKQVPSMAQAGYPLIQNYTWFGFFAPAETPKAVVQQLNTAILRILQDPTVVQRLQAANITDLPLRTPQQFANTVSADMLAWSKIVNAVQQRIQGTPTQPEK